jgi:hypothetical protein
MRVAHPVSTSDTTGAAMLQRRPAYALIGEPDAGGGMASEATAAWLKVRDAGTAGLV